jgi:hypothetical protein
MRAPPKKQVSGVPPSLKSYGVASRFQVSGFEHQPLDIFIDSNLLLRHSGLEDASR